MELAIEIAKRGHAVASIVAHKWAAAISEMKGHAKTLRMLAEQGPCAHYEGAIAEKIAAFAKEGGGAMTASDWRNYKAEWVEPIAKDYRGNTVYDIPPNGQGIATLKALGILDKFDVRSLTAITSNRSTCRSKRWATRSNWSMTRIWTSALASTSGKIDRDGLASGF